MQTLSFRAMGSQVNIWLDSGGDLSGVPPQIEAIEARLSRFRPQSELCHLNRHTREWVSVSEIMQIYVAEALHAAELTDGLVTPLVLKALVMVGYDRDFAALNPPFLVFDEPIFLSDWRDIRIEAGRVWLPDQIDPGGTGKGWTAQRIAAQFEKCLVDLGGDIVARGRSWQVYIDDPFRADHTPFGTVILQNQAIATSGTDYRRWGDGQHHIIDPRTARPSQTDVLSATVIHPDAILAEAFAKAVLLQGSHAGLAWLDQQPDAAGLVFCHDGSVKATRRFQGFMM